MPLTQFHISRRALLAGGGSSALLGLAGCSSTASKQATTLSARIPFKAIEPAQPAEPDLPPAATMYAGIEDSGFKVPPVPWKKLNPRYLRARVPNTTGEPAGTLVVDTANHFVYFTLPNGEAMRYGVGLGREGFEWSGRGYIERKAQWPKWHPPAEMIERDPKLKKYETTYDKKNDLWLGGMDGGPMNPLGARALYIYQDGKDTLFRLHGSPEWNSIGKNVSSGCVRLINQDIIDLHARVPEQTQVIVTSGLPTV
ncbi:MAG: L,D-transpeptidase [Notoacmeibacter sp.]|nr:L,D-transpeptidase [Notoacmeibacter sp.]